MAAYSAILTALETKLKAFADLNGYPVAWPDVEFTPNGQPYLEPFLILSEAGIGGLKAGSFQDNQGIYQVNVVTPKGGGTADQRAIVDAILSEFYKGSPAGGVIIEKAWAGSTLTRNDAWVFVPVSVQIRLIG